ncbi:YfgM family protein [Wenzhouxiangella marina]|uniref:Ancillary SecYEG translocon subunit n=1 Tax=Wenzhouxiangella marina TaxID=1579979 RepID=A0A0K0XW42_9GAMM|nr:tetratricopeptide repeat protein [Wenzhouxiangella marina]AKS41924.1 hypothetical protein WM2015_1554 [Wenzhouxiangella marina]MBB6086309.1 putative negative regulator of RcsB-dependent stress response [Wenzhouxiangella marina]
MAVELYDDHEQGERVRSWINEYGASIVVGLVLAFGGIFGFKYWQGQQEAARLLASEYYSVIQSELSEGRIDFAQEQFDAMKEASGRSAYVGLASLLMAGAYVDDGRLEPAAELYRDVLNNDRLASLHGAASLRLARILQAQGDIGGALAQLEGGAPSGFQGAWAEARGDFFMVRGQLDQARLAYQEAMDNLTGQGIGRSLLQIKIDSTGPAAAEDAS